MEHKEKWNEFAAKYHALIEEYNVDLDFGCGCCIDGHKMDDVYIPSYGTHGYTGV